MAGRENGAEEVLGEAWVSVSGAVDLPAGLDWMRREKCRWRGRSARRQLGGCCG